MKHLYVGWMALLFSYPLSVEAEVFIMPEAGTLYMQAAGGSAAGVTEIGIGTTPQNHISLITGLPFNPSPDSEVVVGFFKSNESVIFSLHTSWGVECWACSDDTATSASLCAFRDLDNSLGWNGNTIEQLGPYEWLLHLDDACSYLADDDDNDVLIALRLEPIAILDLNMVVDPSIVPINRRGGWLACYIKLPVDAGVQDVVLTSILLNDQLAPERYDLVANGTVLKLTFRHDSVRALLEPGMQELWVTGQLADGQIFEAVDTVLATLPPVRR